MKIFLFYKYLAKILGLPEEVLSIKVDNPGFCKTILKRAISYGQCENAVSGQDVILKDLNLENSWPQHWKIFKLDDGWIKFRNDDSKLFLHASKSGTKLTIQDNAKPCNGLEPCIRYL